tara:strand:- start:4905 stop:6392 length:1488 start_codon:yes stop_codon:yes gene_type:complete
VIAALGVHATGQHQLTELGQRLPVSHLWTQCVAVGDIDGDGDLDLVTAEDTGASYGYRIRLYANDGRGIFSDLSATNLPNGGSVGGPPATLELGDLDGDGDLDLVVAGGIAPSSFGYHELLLNDGSGVFSNVSAAQMPPDNQQSWDVAFGDIDADGDLDIVWANYMGNRLYVNNGGGTFTDATATQLPTSSAWTRGVALGDVDGDGDLDLLAANGGQNQLFLNDGAGTFTDATAARMPTDGESTSAVALGDIDDDGDLDLILSNINAQNRLYLNDGSGAFTDVTAVRMPPGGNWTEDVAFADIDADGDLDAILASDLFPSPPVVQLYRNDGAGQFSDATAVAMPPGGDRANALAVGDLDGDGDVDVVLGNDGQDRVFVNLLRQLDALAPPTIGQNYHLDIYARYGVPRHFDVALPYLSLAPASIFVPSLGTIGIDLAQAAPLSPLLIPQAAGVASTSFLVPSNSSLIGVELFAQALHVPYPLSPRLTNATAGTVQ